MDKKVMLIVPPMTYLTSMETIRLAQPVGISYIAGYLEKYGYVVKILDAHAQGYENQIKLGERTQVGLNKEEIIEEIKTFAPKIVGVSSMFSDQYYNTISVCEAAKEAIPNVVTCVGGVHPTMVPTEVLRNSNIDHIIKGEAEHSFKLFCDNIFHNGEINTVIDGLDLLPKRYWSENLDKLPFPARHLLNLKNYINIGRAYREHSKREPALPIITSRCCNAWCKFCATHQMQGHYRERSVDNVIKEIDKLIETWGMKEIYFLDDALVHGNFREILKAMIKNNYDLTWHGANGVAVFSLDDELIDLFAKTGCYKVILSIESGVQSTLKYMKKPVNLKNVKTKIDRIKSRGMKVESMFVIGLPCESREDILNTVKYAESLELDYVSFPICTPFKGTELYEECVENGILVDNYSYENLKFGIGNIRTDNWGPEFVESVRKKAWHKINGL